MVFKLSPEHLLRMNVPKLHWPATISKIPGNLNHKKLISEYVNNIFENISNGQGLYLWGDYGRGKSALAAICAKAAYSLAGCWSYWIKAKTIPSLMITDVDFDEDQTCYERCLDVGLLIIDEFQIREQIRFTEVSVEDLIRMRLDDKKATIVTTNVGLTDLQKNYPAFYHVLQDGLFPIKVQGYDFRADKKGVM